MKEKDVVQPVLMDTESAAITALLREAFGDIASEMGMNAQNCPHHVAFITEERLRKQLDRADAHCFGIRQDGRWIGFVAVAPIRTAMRSPAWRCLPPAGTRAMGVC